ncbi:MAG: hypothetical protein AAFU67_15995 [Bacteroidota bacterium]
MSKLKALYAYLFVGALVLVFAGCKADLRTESVAGPDESIGAVGPDGKPVEEVPLDPVNIDSNSDTEVTDSPNPVRRQTSPGGDGGQAVNPGGDDSDPIEPEEEEIIEDNSRQLILDKFDLEQVSRVAYINEVYRIDNSIASNILDGWSFRWDIGNDGSVEGRDANSFTHTFRSIGPKSITVEATKPEQEPIEWTKNVVVTISLNGLNAITSGLVREAESGGSEDDLIAELNKFEPYIADNVVVTVPGEFGNLSWGADLEDIVVLDLADKKMFSKVSSYEYDKNTGEVTRIVFSK